MKFKEKRPLYRLEEISAILRGDKGCAWDKKQTSASLKPYLIEEAYEVYDAIEAGNPEDLKEELGDLLFQIYSHAQIAREQNHFTMDDVAQNILDKIIRRHPHVFGGDSVDNADEVIHRWEKLKMKEKSHRESILEGVPMSLPALLKAYRVQQKVSRVGFDWERVEDVTAKLEEELSELKEAINTDDREKIIDEAGDILFSIANILRFIHINPEEALLKSINKFIRRFQHIEKRAAEMEKELDQMGIDQLEELWSEAKGII